MKSEKKGGAKASPKKPRKDINRDGQTSRMAELNAIAKAAGWLHLSEYLTAVRAGTASIPSKRAEHRVQSDGLCPNCGRDYFVEETIVNGELRCSCAAAGYANRSAASWLSEGKASGILPARS